MHYNKYSSCYTRANIHTKSLNSPLTLLSEFILNTAFRAFIICGPMIYHIAYISEINDKVFNLSSTCLLQRSTLSCTSQTNMIISFVAERQAVGLASCIFKLFWMRKDLSKICFWLNYYWYHFIFINSTSIIEMASVADVVSLTEMVPHHHNAVNDIWMNKTHRFSNKDRSLDITEFYP